MKPGILIVLLIGACVFSAAAAPINYIMGEYAADDPASRYLAINITMERRFVLWLREHGEGLRVTGRLLLGPSAADRAPQWIDLRPDPQFTRITHPRRLYPLPADSYWVLASRPHLPSHWPRHGAPNDYVCFNDASSLSTPLRFKDVPLR